jgi:hypothetical protein
MFGIDSNNPNLIAIMPADVGYDIFQLMVEYNPIFFINFFSARTDFYLFEYFQLNYTRNITNLRSRRLFNLLFGVLASNVKIYFFYRAA